MSATCDGALPEDPRSLGPNSSSTSLWNRNLQPPLRAPTVALGAGSEAWARGLLTYVEPYAYKVKSSPCPQLGSVALRILDYLSTHPDAQDTAEGIAEWWLLEQRVHNVITDVKKAIAELLAQGLVLERSGRDGRVHYRLNPRRRTTAAQQLQQMPPRPTAAPPTAPVESTSGKTTGRR